MCILLWLSSLLSGLFFTAWVVCKTAYSRRIVRWFFTTLTVLLFLSLFGGTTLLGYFLKTENLRPDWLFNYGASITFCYIAGALLIAGMGYKKLNGKVVAAHWSSTIVGLAFGVFFVMTFSVFHLMDANVRTDMVDLKASATVKAVRLFPPKAMPEKNAVTLYNRALEKLGGEKDLPDWFQDITDADFDVTRPEVKRFLEEKKAALTLAREAAFTSAFFQGLNIDFIVGSEIVSFLDYRNLAKLMVLDAKALAERGDSRNATINLDALESMAEQLWEWPMLLNLMISTVIEEYRFIATEYMLAHSSEVDQYQTNRPIESPAVFRNAFKKTMEAEQAALTQALANVGVKGEFGEVLSGSGLMNMAVAASFWRVFLLPDDMASLKEKFDELNKLLALPYYQGHEKLKKFDESFKDDMGGIMTATVLPSSVNYAVRIDQAVVRRRIIDLAMAVTTYHVEVGEYPSKLDELVPDYVSAIPVDPFDGRPVKMKPVDGGVDIYSAGPENPHDREDLKPVHFYVGEKAYDEFTVKPAAEKRKQEEEKKKNRKKKK